MKVPTDSLFHGKISDFMKIHEILKKHPERDSITVEILSFYQKSGYCMKIDNFL